MSIRRTMDRCFIVTIFVSFFLGQAAYGIGARALHVDGALDRYRKWMETADSDSERVKYLLWALSSSRSGSHVVKKAKTKARRLGKTLYDVISPGDVSITDTTLVRRFHPDNPQEITYETRSHVYINRDHDMVDAVLDLAHELTHFTYKQPFNPYRSNFDLRGFMESTIEGKGGEVEAYLVECRVLEELFPSRFRGDSKCRSVQKGEAFSKQRGVKQFYKIGAYFDQFLEDVNPHGLKRNNFPALSDDQSLFISSAYGLPYPVAALREYTTIMQKVCENDYRRLGILKDTIGRSLASVQKRKQTKLYRKMKRSYQFRCRQFTASNP